MSHYDAFVWPLGSVRDIRSEDRESGLLACGQKQSDWWRVSVLTAQPKICPHWFAQYSVHTHWRLGTAWLCFLRRNKDDFLQGKVKCSCGTGEG